VATGKRKTDLIQRKNGSKLYDHQARTTASIRRGGGEGCSVTEEKERKRENEQ